MKKRWIIAPLLSALLLVGCTQAQPGIQNGAASRETAQIEAQPRDNAPIAAQPRETEPIEIRPRDNARLWSDMEPVGAMALRYAEQFSVDYYADGYALVTIAGEERVLLVPQDAEAPSGLDADITVLRTPVERVYLASSAALDFFRQLGALDLVRFTSTKAEDWSLDEARRALAQGEILYAGKYSAPDYELLLSEGCAFAVENTMIFHAPAAREQLEALGIPVLVERPSYEPHPLGRMEWIRLYGLLVGKEAEAEAFFARQTEAVEAILGAEDTGKTVAFFALSPNGYINVRRSGDYIAKMLALAGGRYVPEGLGDEDGAASSMNIQPEAFYAGAKEADVLIYDGNVYPVGSLAQLLEKSELLADFKAVQEGNVWYTGRSVFQETTAVAGMIGDFRAVLSGGAAGEPTYLRRLK